MGTEYTIVNLSRKIICGFGLDWNPKYTESIINRDCARFLLFLMMEKYRKEQIIIISEGNSWDWNYEVNTDNFEDKSKELLEEYLEWDSEENEVKD